MFLLLLLTLPASLAAPPASGAGAGAALSLEPPPCSTIHGERCIFPSTYLGTTYWECTDVDNPTGPWCATSVSRFGTVVDWGDCQASCCSTIHGERCIFPFTYRGTTYRECTAVDSPTGPWCATSVSRVGTAVDWGDCQASCHLFTPTLPHPTHPHPALCECINPFQGTRLEARGDPDHLCHDKGLCYVACDGGCKDQAPTSHAHTCQSALACEDTLGF